MQAVSAGSPEDDGKRKLGTMGTIWYKNETFVSILH